MIRLEARCLALVIWGQVTYTTRAGQLIGMVYGSGSHERGTTRHDRRLNDGPPVQYSLFEWLLEPEQLNKMNQAVQRVL
jgi:hypothetical protein